MNAKEKILGTDIKQVKRSCRFHSIVNVIILLILSTLPLQAILHFIELGPLRHLSDILLMTMTVILSGPALIKVSGIHWTLSTSLRRNFEISRLVFKQHRFLFLYDITLLLTIYVASCGLEIGLYAMNNSQAVAIGIPWIFISEFILLRMGILKITPHSPRLTAMTASLYAELSGTTGINAAKLEDLCNLLIYQRKHDEADELTRRVVRLAETSPELLMFKQHHNSVGKKARLPESSDLKFLICWDRLGI